MDRLERSSSNGSARPLRIINMVAFIPGIVLLLITALTTPAGAIYFIAIAPLTLSTLLGLVSVAGKDRPMPWTRYADLCLAMFFVAVLVPIWVFLAPRHTVPWVGAVTEALLCAYSTMPLIVDFCIHIYLFFRSIPKVSHYSQPRSCPNCKYAISPSDHGPRWKLYNNGHDLSLRSPYANQLELSANKRSHGNGAGDGNQNIYHVSLTDYQAELAARESSEFQTSGCNTPRRSEETLNSSRFSGDDGFEEGLFDSLV